jgi:ClpP class serine protease
MIWDIIGFGIIAIIGYTFIINSIKNILFKHHLAALEKKYNCVILPIIHNGDEFIDEQTLIHTTEVINRARKKNKKIMIVMHTLGGYLMYAQQISEILNKFENEVIGVIPVQSFSAGTIISLPLNKLLVTKYAVCGPIDAQMPYGYDYYSAKDIISVEHKVDMSETFALTLEVSKKIMSEIRYMTKEYLGNFNIDKKQISRITAKLLDRHSHGYGIKFIELFDFKSEEMSEEMYNDIMQLINLKVKIK